jgi:hypothetical protein
MVIAQPPLQYLITSSQAGLESFVLSRQGQVANLRREALEVLEEWIESETQLRTARWILECRRAQDPDAVPMDRTELTDFDYQSRAPALSPRTMPMFGQPRLAADSRSRAPAQLNGYPRDFAELESAAPSKEALTEHPGVSSRAEDALTCLEHDVRSQGHAIDAGKNCNVVAHSADESVPAGLEAHSRVGERLTETLSCNSFHVTPLPFSEISAAEENDLRACRSRVSESWASETDAVGQSPEPTKPNPVIPIPRKAHNRPLFSIRASFAETQLRRRVV